MSVQTYSLKREGNVSISPHFKVREFACRDGSDTVLVSKELVALLEKIRMAFLRPVIVNSGYRTPSYNAQVGGAKGSQHLLGTAADIVIAGVNPLEVCRYAEARMPSWGGIGHYVDRFAHVDVRPTRSRWQQQKPGMANQLVTGFWQPTLKKGDKGEQVQRLQLGLMRLGLKLPKYGADGGFGNETEEAVRTFQRSRGLTSDGIVGPITWAALEV